MKGSRRLCFGVLILFAAFWLLLGGAAHYSLVDDLQWGTQTGLDWWRYGLLNNRYVGNFCAVVMCRSLTAKTLMMGGAMFFIPYLMARLAARERKEAFLPLFLACNIGVLLMPVELWREVYGWISGFGNYGLSVLAALLWLTTLRHVERSGRQLGRWSAILFVITLAMGLFLEHLALLVLGASLILALYGTVNRGKRLCLPFYACLGGAVLAVYVMFFNDIVLTLLSSGTSLGGRRALSFAPGEGLGAAVGQIAGRYFGVLLPQAFLHGIHISLPLAVIIARAFWESRARWMALLGALPLALSGWVWWTGGCAVPSVAVLCWVLPLGALLAQRCSGRIKAGRILLFLAAPVSLAPVAAVAISGWRFYFFPMVMLILVAADTAAPVLERRSVLWGTALLATVLLAPWVYRGSNVLACNIVEQQLIHQVRAGGGKILILPTDRYDAQQWYVRNPWSAEGAYYYRERFGLSKDVTLIFLPAGSFDTWPDISDEVWEKRVELPPSDEFVYTMPVIS